MGFKDAWNAQMERSKNSAVYGTHVISAGQYSYLPEGGFKKIKKPIAGAVAEYEHGADIGGRTTLTRVAAGAIIAGPVGAVVGGMFKKDRNRVYVTITFPDGAIVVVDGPAKNERKLRDFASKVNAAASRAADA